MDFNTEFIMELFMDDSVTTVNGLVVSAANILNENSDNIAKINELLVMGQNHLLLHPISNNTEKSKTSAVVQITDFYENIVQNYNDSDYTERLKMKKNTVQAIISFLTDIVNCASSVVPLDKKVHVFLWVLTSEESYNEIGSMFGLNRSSVGYIFHEIASLLAQHKHDFITWPSLEEQHVTRVKVNSLHKFPNCIGFIDACRLKVGSKHNKRTPPDPILLQAVCDESLMFMDIHVGSIGLTRKSKLYRESNLSQELKNFVEFENHILGDTEYKLKKNLITPFSSEQFLTSEEMKFNEIHWKTRAYIGHAFEILRNRFKRLNHLDISKPEALKSVICAACVLHNFVLLHEDCAMVKNECVTCDDDITIDSNLVTTAVEKRQFLCNYINYIATI